MRAYCEITVLPNPEVNVHFLWSKVFQQLHLALVEIQNDQKQVPVGVAFPEYKVGNKYGVLGGKCRLFAADQATLERLNITQWLARLADYVHVTSIRPVPDKVAGYACYQRAQPKTNPLRLARRYASRHGMDVETAFNATIQPKPAADGAQLPAFRYCDLPAQSVRLPFIRLNSLSSERSFCLWINKVEGQSANAGVFSTYGLSATSTVPEF
jgi:CRISPR-associated endonuclease Csy4